MSFIYIDGDKLGIYFLSQILSCLDDRSNIKEQRLRRTAKLKNKIKLIHDKCLGVNAVILIICGLTVHVYQFISLALVRKDSMYEG